MTDLREKFDFARKRLRDKLGLPATLPAEIEPSAVSTDDSDSGLSVLHRVLAFEDNTQASEAVKPLDSDIIPLPAALSHSLSGTWRQHMAEDGKQVWHRDARAAASNEVGLFQKVWSGCSAESQVPLLNSSCCPPLFATHDTTVTRKISIQACLQHRLLKPQSTRLCSLFSNQIQHTGSKAPHLQLINNFQTTDNCCCNCLKCTH